MADISDKLQFATVPPQDAAKHIEDARVFNVGADDYVDFKPHMQEDVDLLKLNSKVTPAVAEYSALSSQHTSLIKNDTFKLSQVETLFSKGRNKINGVDLSAKVTALEAKEGSDAFTENDAVELYTLREQVREHREFNVDKPGKHDEVINKYFEKQKEVNTFKSVLNAFAGNVSSELANVSQIPALAFDTLLYSTNLIRRLKGEFEIPTPEILTKNPMYQKFSKLADEFNAMAPELNKDVSDSLANGDFVEAGQIAAVKLAGIIPNLATTLGTFVTLGPNAAMGKVIATSGAGFNIENKEKGIAPTTGLSNALTKAGIEGFAERIGTIGLFKRLESSLTYSFGKDAASKVIFNMSKSMLGAAGQEATEEGITSIAQDFTDIVSGVDPGKIEGIGGRALESALLGGLMGGGIVAPGAALKARTNIYNIGVRKDAIKEAVSVLEFDSNLSKAIEILKDTDIAKFSPSETENLLKKIFKGLPVFVDKVALSKFTDNPEKAQAVRNIIDPTGEAAAKLNAPIAIPAHKFIGLVRQYPESQGLYQMSPEQMSVQQAKEFLDATNASNEERQAVMEKLNAPDAKPEDLKMIKEALDPEQPSAVYPSNDVFGEAEYLDTTKMEEALKGIMPESEIKKYVADQKKAKQQVVDTINETATYEMNQVVDVGVEEALEAEKQAQLQRIENNPNVELVERFVNPTSLSNDKVLQSVLGMELNHSKKGYSPLAIDPSTLPKELKSLRSNERLKKNKVFIKGGLNVNDAAALLGFPTAEDLLDVLSNTLTKQEIAEQRTQARKADIESEVKKQVGLNETNIEKAYMARLTNALETMRIMKDDFWSSTKTGIKRLFFTPPTIKEVDAEAKQTILKTKVKDLNVNQYKVGERKSERIVWESITKNQVEKAYINQHAIVKNIALAAQTHVMTTKINRVIKLAIKFKDPKVIRELREAGDIYYDAALEIIENYNLTTKKSNKAEKDSFIKWSKHVAENGAAAYRIPERLADQRESLPEMTVEQVLAAGNALKSILHQARKKNKLHKKFENIKELQTLERFGEIAEQKAKEVFDYNKDAAAQNQQDISTTQKAGEYLLKLSNHLERTQHIIAKLDNNKATGFFNTIFWRPLVDAGARKKDLLDKTADHIDDLIKAFGKEDFENMANEVLTVDEFKGMPGFPDGKITKAQLFAMELNFGNEGNLKELEKFGIKEGVQVFDRKTIRKILDRELSDKHTALAQNIWNIFESFVPEMKALEKRTEGLDDVDWVQGKSFEARGRVYPGGYYPIKRYVDEPKIKAKEVLGAGQLNTLNKFAQSYYGKGMTEQGHLESRVGNDDILSLDLRHMPHAIAQVIHDLTHREVIADGAKLLADKKIRDAIVSVVGKAGYSNIVNTYIETANATDKDFSDPLTGVVNSVTNGLQMVAIGGKFSSVMVQPISVMVAMNRMGPKSFNHFVKTIQDLSNNPTLIFSFVGFAEEINPAMIQFTEDVSKNSASRMLEQLPKKFNKYLKLPDRMRKHLGDIAFFMLTRADQLNKTIVTLTAYRMAMEGDVEGIRKGDHDAAAIYASNMSELTQTHNDIRNLPPAMRDSRFRMFLLFFNDLNNQYNHYLRQGREMRKDFKAKNHLQALLKLGGLMLTLSVIKLYDNAIRGKPFPGEDDDDDPSMSGQIKAWAKFMLLQTPVETGLSTIPLGRDMSFAWSKSWERRKSVQLPLESALSEFTTSLHALYTYLSNIEWMASAKSGKIITEGKDFTNQQIKAMFLSAGMLTKLPTGTLYNVYREKRDKEYLQQGLFDRLTPLLKKSINNPDLQQEFKDDLKKIQDQISPQSVKVPTTMYDTLKETLSNSNPTAFNEDNGAAGIYQFTEEAWNNISNQAPQLVLTDNGRVSKNTEQQEQAFKYETEENSKVLKAAGIEPTVENIYGAHMVGVLKLIEIYNAPKDAKLNTLVDETILKANKIDADMKVLEFQDWLVFKTLEADDRLTNKPKN